MANELATFGQVVFESGRNYQKIKRGNEKKFNGKIVTHIVPALDF